MVWLYKYIHVDKYRLYRNLEWSHRRRDHLRARARADSKSELPPRYKVNKHNILLFFGHLT